jgi:hypothetical protein
MTVPNQSKAHYTKARAASRRLGLLALDIVETIVEGRTDDRMMLKVLERTLPVDSEEQREHLM